MSWGHNSLGVFSICTPSFPASAFLLSLLNVGSQGTNGEPYPAFFFFLRQEPGLGCGVGGWAARMTVGRALPWLTEIEKPEWEITMRALPLIQFCTDIRDVKSP